jgi:hypothetical protein
MSTTPTRLARAARCLGLAAALAAASPAGPARAADPAPATQGDAWKTEFADICSKTQDAMTLSDADLRALVERCDRLKPALAKLDEPLRKVYGQRLRACRELYQFVLDSRVKEPST